ncbi:MAG: hypothetical protein PVG65_05775 [Candidatus Thorarchaeota archaeon]|jgi:hypothetical protein
MNKNPVQKKVSILMRATWLIILAYIAGLASYSIISHYKQTSNSISKYGKSDYSFNVILKDNIEANVSLKIENNVKVSRKILEGIASDSKEVIRHYTSERLLSKLYILSQLLEIVKNRWVSPNNVVVHVRIFFENRKGSHYLDFDI